MIIYSYFFINPDDDWWQDRSDKKNLEIKFLLGFENSRAERIPADNNFAGQSPNFPSNAFYWQLKIFVFFRWKTSVGCAHRWSVRSGYPEFKLPELNNRETWVIVTRSIPVRTITTKRNWQTGDFQIPPLTGLKRKPYNPAFTIYFWGSCCLKLAASYIDDNSVVTSNFVFLPNCTSESVCTLGGPHEYFVTVVLLSYCRAFAGRRQVRRERKHHLKKTHPLCQVSGVQ
jgi:hypothetical protein